MKKEEDPYTNIIVCVCYVCVFLGCFLNFGLCSFVVG